MARSKVQDENKPKVKYLQVRLTDEDDAVLDRLTEIYQIDRSALVRFALSHVLTTRPTFNIVPQANH